MKKLFLILVLVFFAINISLAQRSQEAMNLKIKTSSEIRAKNMMDKFSVKFGLTEEQREDLEDVVREYLDESQKVYQLPNPEAALVRIEAYRDKRAKKVLTKPEQFSEFLKEMDDLKAQQGRGFGRK